jgi:hypothetical protein
MCGRACAVPEKERAVRGPWNLRTTVQLAIGRTHD